MTRKRENLQRICHTNKPNLPPHTLYNEFNAKVCAPRHKLAMWCAQVKDHLMNIIIIRNESKTLCVGFGYDRAQNNTLLAMIGQIFVAINKQIKLN